MCEISVEVISGYFDSAHRGLQRQQQAIWEQCQVPNVTLEDAMQTSLELHLNLRTKSSVRALLQGRPQAGELP